MSKKQVSKQQVWLEPSHKCTQCGAKLQYIEEITGGVCTTCQELIYIRM